VTWIGIDPGIDGAMCVMEQDQDRAVDIWFYDCPTYQDGKKRRIDVAGLIDLFRGIDPGHSHAFLEKVSAGVFSMPGQKMGSVSAFSFGYGYGVWMGVLAALKIPYTLVTPNAWKKAMMNGEPKEKGASRAVARRLYPDQLAESLSRKRDHNRSDSCLLAEYGRRLLIQRPHRSFGAQPE
jgi:crossover junction endodeoxyribonuclease RuvC